MSLVRAQLAAKEWEALEVIKGDLCEWLALILELDISPSTFLGVLETGVHLCRLASLVQQQARAAAADGGGNSWSARVPLEPLNCVAMGKAGSSSNSFYARDNASNFISWCRGLGVQEAVVFESEGLVLHRDEKRVILCLLDVARFAERVGLPPPQLVRMEREIEALEEEEGLERQMSDKEERRDDEDECNPGTQQAVDQNCPNQDSLAGTTPDSVPADSSTVQDLSSVESKADQRRKVFVSRIPVRRSRRLLDKGPRYMPSAELRGNVGASLKKRCFDDREGVVSRSTAAKSRKRRRDSEEEEEGQGEAPSPSHKRTKMKEIQSDSLVSKNRRDPPKPVAEKVSLDESVMRKMAECTCQNKIEVTNCGNGKFLVKGASGKIMTTYARVSQLTSCQPVHY